MSTSTASGALALKAPVITSFSEHRISSSYGSIALVLQPSIIALARTTGLAPTYSMRIYLGFPWLPDLAGFHIQTAQLRWYVSDYDTAYPFKDIESYCIETAAWDDESILLDLESIVFGSRASTGFVGLPVGPKGIRVEGSASHDEFLATGLHAVYEANPTPAFLTACISIDEYAGYEADEVVQAIDGLIFGQGPAFDENANYTLALVPSFWLGLQYSVQHDVEGDLALPIPATAATIALAHDVQGALSLGIPSLEMGSNLGWNISGNINLGIFWGKGYGDFPVRKVTGEMVFPSMLTDGTGHSNTIITCEGAASLPSFSGDGRGSFTTSFTGEGSPSFPEMGMRGAGNVTAAPITHTASGAFTLTSVSGTGRGTTNSTGISMLFAPAFNIHGSARAYRHFGCSGDLTFGEFICAGAGSISRFASGTLALNEFTLDSGGKRGATADGVLALPILESEAAMVVMRKIAGSLLMPKPTLTAVQSRTHSASGALLMPSAWGMEYAGHLSRIFSGALQMPQFLMFSLTPKAQEHLYRVTKITSVPGDPTKLVSLEAVTKPATGGVE